MIKVIVYGKSISQSIIDGNFKVKREVTYNSSGEQEYSYDISLFIEYLKDDYIDNLDEVSNVDTELIDGEYETSLILNENEVCYNY